MLLDVNSQTSTSVGGFGTTLHGFYTVLVIRHSRKVATALLRLIADDCKFERRHFSTGSSINSARSHGRHGLSRNPHVAPWSVRDIARTTAATARINLPRHRTEDDAHVTCAAVVDQGNHLGVFLHTINTDAHDAAALPRGILDADAVLGSLHPPHHLVSRPGGGNTGIYGEGVAGPSQAQNALDPDAIHARIPRRHDRLISLALGCRFRSPPVLRCQTASRRRAATLAVSGPSAFAIAGPSVTLSGGRPEGRHGLCNGMNA